MTQEFDVSDFVEELSALRTSRPQVPDKVIKEHLFRLGQSASPSDVEAESLIKEFTKSDSSELVRTWAVWALRDGGFDCDIEMCEALRRDRSRTVRIAVVQWIHSRADNRGIGVLEALSVDKESSVRCEVAKACVGMPGSSAVLQRLIADDESIVRFFATDAASENSDIETIPALSLLESQARFLERRRVRGAIRKLKSGKIS